MGYATEESPGKNRNQKVAFEPGASPSSWRPAVKPVGVDEEQGSERHLQPVTAFFPFSLSNYLSSLLLLSLKTTTGIILPEIACLLLMQ